MPKGRPIAVRNVPWHIITMDGVLKPASRSGFWNLWPHRGGDALRTMIDSHEAARLWPEQADAILARRDSTD